MDDFELAVVVVGAFWFCEPKNPVPPEPELVVDIAEGKVVRPVSPSEFVEVCEG